MSGYDIFAAVMMMALIAVTLWGLKPMWDSVNRDLRRRKEG